MGKLTQKAEKALQAALRKARQWRRPPHWDHRTWQEELDAIAHASAFEACSCFDGQRGVPLEGFVSRQVLTALRDFHRREWAYFVVHCGHLPRVDDEGKTAESEEGEEVCWVEIAIEEREWRRHLIDWALKRLSGQERQVIRGLYWEGRREAEIAREMGISQQAVSKIKQKALQKLKEWLKGLL